MWAYNTEEAFTQREWKQQFEICHQQPRQVTQLEGSKKENRSSSKKQKTSNATQQTDVTLWSEVNPHGTASRGGDPLRVS